MPLSALTKVNKIKRTAILEFIEFHTIPMSLQTDKRKYTSNHLLSYTSFNNYVDIECIRAQNQCSHCFDLNLLYLNWNLFLFRCSFAFEFLFCQLIFSIILVVVSLQANLIIPIKLYYMHKSK